MGLGSYISLQYKFDQAERLADLDDPRVRNGVCLMLTINWLDRVCQEANVTTAPVTAMNWLGTTILNGRVLLKQIANQHAAYLSDNTGKTRLELIKKLASLATQQRLRVHGEYPYTNTIASMQGALDGATGAMSQGKVGVVVFQFGKDGHAIGVSCRDPATTTLFDPNYGLIMIAATPPTNALDTPRGAGVVKEILETYKIDRGEVYELGP